LACQAVAQGVSALADKEQTELQAEWQREDIAHRELEKEWRYQASTPLSIYSRQTGSSTHRTMKTFSLVVITFCVLVTKKQNHKGHVFPQRNHHVRLITHT
jgi:hypothetical protein